MSGLIQQAGGSPAAAQGALERAQPAWQESMLRQVNALRDGLRLQDPANLPIARPHGSTAGPCGSRTGGRTSGWIGLPWRSAGSGQAALGVRYRHVAVLPDAPRPAPPWPTAGSATATFPAAHSISGPSRATAATGWPRPSGTGRRSWTTAARALAGCRCRRWPSMLSRSSPCRAIRLAGVLWPGDDEFPARASVLFDAADSEYMTTDGLALLGRGLAGRLIARQACLPPASEPKP